MKDRLIIQNEVTQERTERIYIERDQGIKARMNNKKEPREAIILRVLRLEWKSRIERSS